MDYGHANDRLFVEFEQAKQNGSVQEVSQLMSSIDSLPLSEQAKLEELRCDMDDYLRDADEDEEMEM